MRTLARAVIAAVLGAVALIVWGMVFWGFLADPLGVFHRLPNDAAVTRTLVEGGATTGTYFMPWPRDSAESFERFVAQHRSGPFFRLHYVREGVDPNSAGKLLKGTFHYFTVAALAVALAMLAAGSFARKLGVIVLAGLLGSDLITIGDPVWFHMPWDHTRGVLLFEILSWLLLGFVVAQFAPTYYSSSSSG
jgi:hypothetical protein